MAAFSYQHHPFLHDSLFQPNTSIMTSDVSQQPSNPATCFSQFCPYEPPLQGTPLDVGIRESSCLELGREVAPTSNNQPSLTDKHSTDSSSVVDKLGGGELVAQKMTAVDKKRKSRNGSSSNSAQSKNAREAKGDKHKQCNGVIKVVEKKKPRADKKDQNKVPEEAPTGYIHVRARRGQATDSHSLAERVRREKISERMKLLQALVPGCDKVTGKALMLDEIINYVQSLQNQVEFLSMRLASLNPIFFDYGADLDALMVRPDQGLSGLTSPLANVQQCIPAQVTALSDITTTFTTASNHNTLLDTSSSLLLQQRQMPDVHAQPQRHNVQDNGQLLWDVNKQRQKIISQSMASNLCSFH